MRVVACSVTTYLHTSKSRMAASAPTASSTFCGFTEENTSTKLSCSSPNIEGIWKISTRPMPTDKSSTRGVTHLCFFGCKRSGACLLRKFSTAF